MRTRRWRVLMLDSGPTPREFPALEVFRRFGAGGTDADALSVDAAGHGTRIASIICRARPEPELGVAQVLDGRGHATADDVAAALRWATELQPDLVHMSLGLTADRPAISAAIDALVRAGVVCVASAPARGAPVFPAACPGVIAASGDARCGPDEIAVLAPNVAQFGGCAVLRDAAGREWRGASIGAAHVTRCIVGELEPGTPVAVIRGELAALARFPGPERRARKA